MIRLREASKTKLWTTYLKSKPPTLHFYVHRTSTRPQLTDVTSHSSGIRNALVWSRSVFQTVSVERCGRPSLGRYISASSTPGCMNGYSQKTKAGPVRARRRSRRTFTGVYLNIPLTSPKMVSARCGESYKRIPSRTQKLVIVRYAMRYCFRTDRLIATFQGDEHTSSCNLDVGLNSILLVLVLKHA